MKKMIIDNIQYLDWDVPANVRAAYTLKFGGVSDGAYQSFNLGNHVGDDRTNVKKNRKQLSESITKSMAQRPCSSYITWLKQVHGTRVVRLPLLATDSAIEIEADASVTSQKNHLCTVMTADCLPVFFCDQQSNGLASQVAVAHAGWRGLLAGVLQNTVSEFQNPQSVIAYLGPAISQQAFEVGEEVKEDFIKSYCDVNDDFAKHFVPSTLSPHSSHRYMADIYGLARSLLKSMGVQKIYGGERCTYSESSDFFSYRRDGKTGRMANVIWVD